MKISQISYSQSKETMYGIGLKRWDKCAVEIQIEENDNPENAFQMAKQLVNEQIEKSIAMDDECRGTKVVDIEQEVPLNPKESLIQSILQCTTLDGADGLLSFKKLAENNAEIKAVYDLQLLKLKK